LPERYAEAMRVLITGANGGLGPSVVERFLAGGATVLGVARSWSGPTNFTQISADLTNPAECQRVALENGDLDTVVHVMGGFAPGGSDDVWERMLSLNLISAVHMFNAILPGMRGRKSGSLIAVGSRVAVDPVAGLAAYGASKAALAHYIRTLALELSDTGVRANGVLLSTIDTEANRRAMPKSDHTKWVQPASIAKVVWWLASDDAADVSGALMPVYGRA
jgi:NAD(P)-dependent dehydrogenase (short-subunit alcohol dehydrogenase family)